jgi:hypothetical protein
MDDASGTNSFFGCDSDVSVDRRSFGKLVSWGNKNSLLVNLIETNRLRAGVSILNRVRS